MSRETDFRVLLYYCFADIEDPAAFRDAELERCRRLGLCGRIYISREGLNGTCAGPAGALRSYQQEIEAIPGFAGIEWKEESVERLPFRTLRVRERRRIVNLGLSDEEEVVPAEEGGVHLEPEDWKALLDSGREVTILDVRNRYEAMVGRFRGARPAPYETFAEFPKWVEELEDVPRDQPVLTYCTGGIRCEKFTGLLRRAGFREVYQLRGGILNYAKRVGGAHYVGECYVFDDRVSVAIPGAEEASLASCIRCGAATSAIRNCANMDCHRIIFLCDACLVPRKGCCSAACEDAPRLRAVDASRGLQPWRSRGLERLADVGEDQRHDR